MDDQLHELILYACPQGGLAMQLNAYFSRARVECGLNSAHRYPPHVTLTGFFQDTTESIPKYASALRRALLLGQRQARCEVRIERMLFEPNFHGLAIDSLWLKHLTASFAAAAHTKTRAGALRLKDWLHLSLAYEFDPVHDTHLRHMAVEMIDIDAPVSWEVRLYERHGHEQWRCHAGWLMRA